MRLELPNDFPVIENKKFVKEEAAVLQVLGRPGSALNPTPFPAFATLSDLPREHWFKWEGGARCPINAAVTVEWVNKEGRAVQNAASTAHLKHPKSWSHSDEVEEGVHVIKFRILADA